MTSINFNMPSHAAVTRRTVMVAGGRGAQIAAACLLLTAVCTAVQAQTSYLLTTLKPASSSQPMNRTQHFALDASDRVMGYTDFELGYQMPMCIPGLGCFGGTKTYTTPPAVWPATTATSVAPVKLSNLSLGSISSSESGAGVGMAVSPDARVVAGAQSGLVFNASNGVLIGMPGQVLDANGLSYLFSGVSIPKRGIDNRGIVAANQHGITYLWDLSARLARTVDTTLSDTMPLPPTVDMGAYRGIQVNALTSTAWMVGEVWPDSDRLPQEGLQERLFPAVWRHGQLQVIDQNRGRAVATNVSGQVVIQRANKIYTVWSPGSERAIAPLAAGQVVVPSAINAAGVVVGRSGTSDTEAPDVFNYAGGRAFIWANGVTTDLTNHVKARGAKLPSGAVLEDAREINDKGSVVAVMRNWLGTRSIVRLTAKP